MAHPNGHAGELRDVSQVYRQGMVPVRALDGVSLRVSAGAFVAVMGASGSGKSSLLHVAAGLTMPYTGEVCLFVQALHRMTDNELTRYRCEHVGLIFQTFNLLPTMTALENVGLPLLIQGKPHADGWQRALDGLSTPHNHLRGICTRLRNSSIITQPGRASATPFRGEGRNPYCHPCPPHCAAGLRSSPTASADRSAPHHLATSGPVILPALPR